MKMLTILKPFAQILNTGMITFVLIAIWIFPVNHILPPPIAPSSATPFIGTFDGNYHVISNLTVSGASNLGLFGYIGTDGYVTSLGLDSPSITATGNYTGAIVGYNYYGQITQSYVTDAQITANDQNGIFCGRNNYGSITDCYATGVIAADDHTGGFCGYNDHAAISNCYSNCQMNGGGNAGLFLGTNYYGTISNNYCYAYAGRDNGLATSLNDVQMQDQMYFTGFDFSGVWSIVSGHCPKLSYQTSDGPLPYGLTLSTTLAGSGTNDDPYLIADYDDLLEFRNNSSLRSGCYELTADIDLGGLSITESFIPQRFMGTFEGNGHGHKQLYN